MMIFEVRERFFFLWKLDPQEFRWHSFTERKFFSTFFSLFSFLTTSSNSKEFHFFFHSSKEIEEKKLFLLFLFVCHLNLRHFLRRKFVNFSYHHFYWCVTKQIYGEIREIYGKFSDIISMKNFTVYWLKIEIFAKFLQPKSDKSDKISCSEKHINFHQLKNHIVEVKGSKNINRCRSSGQIFKNFQFYDICCFARRAPKWIKKFNQKLLRSSFNHFTQDWIIMTFIFTFFFHLPAEELNNNKHIYDHRYKRGCLKRGLSQFFISSSLCFCVWEKHKKVNFTTVWFTA